MGTGPATDFATVAFVKPRERDAKQIARVRHASRTFVLIILTSEFAKRIHAHVYVLPRQRQLERLVSSNDYPVQKLRAMCNLYLCDAPVFSDKPRDKEKISTGRYNAIKFSTPVRLALERDKGDNLRCSLR